MTVTSWISPKARKGDPSGIAGRGLFAVEPLAAGEVVAVKGGHIADAATLLALPERLQNSEIQIAEGLHLVALTDDEYEPVMLFVNHLAGEGADNSRWPSPASRREGQATRCLRGCAYRRSL